LGAQSLVPLQLVPIFRRVQSLVLSATHNKSTERGQRLSFRWALASSRFKRKEQT
jgi:hypothetical protein